MRMHNASRARINNKMFLTERVGRRNKFPVETGVTNKKKKEKKELPLAKR